MYELLLPNILITMKLTPHVAHELILIFVHDMMADNTTLTKLQTYKYMETRGCPKS